MNTNIWRDFQICPSELYGVIITRAQFRQKISKVSVKNIFRNCYVFITWLVNYDLAKAQKLKYFTVCSCHVTYGFQSESTFYICLNFKELLFRSRCEILCLSDSNPEPVSS